MEKAISLLADLPDINVKNADGACLLHTAIAYKNHAVIKPLLEAGIDVNAVDADGLTPLHYAAVYQNASVAEEILSRGGDLGIIDRYGNTALWRAVFHARGKYEVVEVFLRHGGGKFATTKNLHGTSPLDMATQFGEKQLIEMLQS
ncbi:MAG: ankyrin repeat domain-containing protein [Planctomycetales bacterium]